MEIAGGASLSSRPGCLRRGNMYQEESSGFSYHSEELEKAISIHT